MSFTVGITCPHGNDQNKCPCKAFKVSCSSFTAAEWGLVDVVTLKIEKNRHVVNLCDSAGYTMLHYAAQHGHTDVVSLLIKEGAIVDSNKCGSTALHRACYAGHLGCVIILVENGANPMICDMSCGNRIENAFHKAARSGSSQVLNWLKDKFPGAADDIQCNDVSFSSGEMNFTPTESKNMTPIPIDSEIGVACPYCKEMTIRMTRMPCCINYSCRKCFRLETQNLFGCKLCRREDPKN